MPGNRTPLEEHDGVRPKEESTQEPLGGQEIDVDALSPDEKCFKYLQLEKCSSRRHVAELEKCIKHLQLKAEKTEAENLLLKADHEKLKAENMEWRMKEWQRQREGKR